ncbi:hypothetical protein ACNOYE_30025 [Nannocystaceae bacterium ST9]
MRHRVDEIGFASPSGLADRTRYTFRATSPRAQLEVELLGGAAEFERAAGSGSPAELAIADVRQQMIDGLGSALTIVGEGEIAVAGKPGRFLHYQFSERGAEQQGFVVIAELADDDWVQLAWQLEGDAGAVRGAVDPVLASFARGSEDAPAIGTNLRRAGGWQFELPSRYAGPRSFAWVDEDAELRLAIGVHPFDVDKPELDARVAALEARGFTLERRDDVPIIHGDMVRLHLRDASGEAWFACRAAQAYPIGNPVRDRWVEVSIEARLADEATARKRVDDLLASIAVEERR